MYIYIYIYIYIYMYIAVPQSRQTAGLRSFCEPQKPPSQAPKLASP